MRIVAGRWADRALTSPGGRVRPTAETVRERAMKLVAADLDDARVVDLYAGTGALGLEAVSRGARSVDLVESQPAALHALKANVAALRARDVARVFKRDVLDFLQRVQPLAYDVAFADPPYASRQSERVVERWLAQPFARVLLVEHATTRKLPPGGRATRLDDTTLTVYRAPRD